MANKFTQKAENVLRAALALAEELGHRYIGTEHLLFALASFEAVRKIFTCASGRITVPMSLPSMIT